MACLIFVHCLNVSDVWKYLFLFDGTNSVISLCTPQRAAVKHDNQIILNFGNLHMNNYTYIYVHLILNV